MNDDYDNFDEYNDAADDWEAEAAEEEAREKEILEQKANIEEQKLKKRIKAPAKVKKEEEEEETIAADIAAALITMKEKASSAGEAMHLLGDGDEGARRLIADMPVKTEQDATELGEAIAKRLLTFSRLPHFNTMLAVVFQDFAQEFRTLYAANMEATRVHVSSEEAKRRIKKAKKAKGSNHHDDAATIETTVNKEPDIEKKDRDALDFDAVNDAGGAAGVSIEEEDFM
ncbi:hypothetical protein, conserved [Trypanosoma cruzi]|uniref:Uncharacterized protein n=1 Tax=Trypanosoma cruzi (strain CL Brener) TaxID=353153 RepID=Q4E2I5_TRYCC|nr:hypothetical protein, conserved [Trypanosoma cruzi]EAN98984.1 hypothetical protein, conserved [Trypanosoma cruzi]|eukprot:XP_820835.1 hypothetical protein [Trypanosoma cruzi strain CL Brener]